MRQLNACHVQLVQQQNGANQAVQENFQHILGKLKEMNVKIKANTIQIAEQKAQAEQALAVYAKVQAQLENRLRAFLGPVEEQLGELARASKIQQIADRVLQK